VKYEHIQLLLRVCFWTSGLLAGPVMGVRGEGGLTLPEKRYPYLGINVSPNNALT